MPDINVNYVLSEDDQQLVTPEGKVWTFVEPLSGRGQAGFAAFYKDENNQIYLVKRDEPGVCLAEASATNEFLPIQYRNTISCAKIGILNNGDIITIQPRVMGTKGTETHALDKLVYGKKRSPKRLRSDEAWNKEQIRNYLANLEPEARRSLACGLFASTALGDESLHLGQFMAITGMDGKKVERIVRIDFGARERFSKERLEKRDFSPIKTSKLYRSSGQIGKDYISFLLADPRVKSSYLTLWANADVPKIVAAQFRKFNEQLVVLPEEQRQLALREFAKEIQKTSFLSSIFKRAFQSSGDKQNFLNEYIQILNRRCEQMQEQAREELNKIISSHPLDNSEKRAVEKLIFTQEMIDVEACKLLEDVKEKNRNPVLVNYLNAAMEWRGINSEQDEDVTDSESRDSTVSIIISLGGALFMPTEDLHEENKDEKRLIETASPVTVSTDASDKDSDLEDMPSQRRSI